MADSSLAHDHDRKLPLYARFGVPEVWLVDLGGGHLDAYRNPEKGAYRTSLRLQDLSRVEIAALPDRNDGTCGRWKNLTPEIELL